MAFSSRVLRNVMDFFRFKIPMNLWIIWICLLVFSTDISGQRLSGSSTSIAVLNRPFQFTCTGSVTTTTLAFIRDRTSLCIIISPSDPARCAEFTSEAGYSCSCGSSGVFYMNIANVSLQDEDRWNCGTGDFINLPVYYKPSVSGFPDPFHIKEHTDLSLDCSSYTQSTPAVTSYRWTGPGGYSSVGPVLSISSINRDKTGDFRCTATNSIGSGTGLARVNVQFLPTVSGQDPSYPVRELSPLNIGCRTYTTVGNPPSTSYRWTGPNSFSSSQPILYISSIRRNQAGIYTCNATNTLTPTGGSAESGIGEGQFSVDVQYKPSVSGFPDPFYITEDTDLSLDCSSYTQSNPAVTSYRWTGPGGYSSVGPVLFISSINRDKTGNFTCTVTNIIGTGTGLARVNVRHGPGSSVSISPQTMLERVEGSGPVTVTCSADCFPPCSFKWMMGNKETESHQLHIANVSRTDVGSYSCEAWNGVGDRAQRDFVLDVFYLDVPVLSLSKTEVRENDTVEMSCEVVSNPTVRMVIENIDNRTELVNKLTNREDFTVQHARCLHNGVYRCTANNQKTGTSLYVNKTLSVLCSPRPDFRVDLIRIVSRELNQSVRLNATFIANPAPSFSWYRVENNGRAAIGNQTVHKITNVHFSTSLQINLTHTRDYSDYAAVAENDIGHDATIYTLTTSGPPYPPLNPVITLLGSTFLGLEWLSDYNSGSDQTFQLEFRTLDSSEWKTAAEVRDPGLRKTVQTNLTDLSPSTTYHIRLYSKNRFGKSDSILLNATTLQEQSISGKESGFSAGLGLGIGLGIGSCIFVILAVLVGVFLYKRHTRQQKEKRNILDTEMNQDLSSTELSDYQRNVYDSLDRTGQGQTYEQMTPGSNTGDSQQNVYESLDRTGQGQTYEQMTPGNITGECITSTKPGRDSEKTALYINQIKLQESDGKNVYYNQTHDLDT